jgi:hypothetical protein
MVFGREIDMRRLIWIVLMLPFVVGCTTSSYSNNMKAATVQATVIVGTKALLDEVALDKYDSTKKLVVDISTDVAKFLDSGKIADLPLEQAKIAVSKFMIDRGWGQYVSMVMAAFDMIGSQTVPIPLGPDNIAIIKMGLASMADSANTSRVEWRRTETQAKSPNRVKAYRR